MAFVLRTVAKAYQLKLFPKHLFHWSDRILLGLAIANTKFIEILDISLGVPFLMVYLNVLDHRLVRLFVELWGLHQVPLFAENGLVGFVLFKLRTSVLRVTHQILIFDL